MGVAGGSGIETLALGSYICTMAFQKAIVDVASLVQLAMDGVGVPVTDA